MIKTFTSLIVVVFFQFMGVKQQVIKYEIQNETHVFAKTSLCLQAPPTCTCMYTITQQDLRLSLRAIDQSRVITVKESPPFG